MSVDVFMLRAGLVTGGELTDEHRDLLSSIAEDFLSCGGAISLSEYHDFSEETREAFCEARNRLEDERVRAIVEALTPTEDDLAGEAAQAIAEERAAQLEGGA